MDAMTETRCTAHYQFRDGNWEVEIAEIPQVHTFGRTLSKAQAHIRDALALWLQNEHPEALAIDDDFTALPGNLADVLADAKRTRQQAAQLSERAQQLTGLAARELVLNLGLPVRDAARLLDVSHQRIHQLVHDAEKRSA
jgi:predicted RNase H-like HicB family nuclease